MDVNMVCGKYNFKTWSWAWNESSQDEASRTSMNRYRFPGPRKPDGSCFFYLGDQLSRTRDLILFSLFAALPFSLVIRCPIFLGKPLLKTCCLPMVVPFS